MYDSIGFSSFDISTGVLFVCPSSLTLYMSDDGDDNASLSDGIQFVVVSVGVQFCRSFGISLLEISLLIDNVSDKHLKSSPIKSSYEVVLLQSGIIVCMFSVIPHICRQSDKIEDIFDDQ